MFVTPSRQLVPSPDEDAEEEERQIAADPDAPEATEEELKTARPFAKAFPDLMESIKRAREQSKKRRR